MKQYTIGIDLGTSSVKLFVAGGDIPPVRAEYENGDLAGGVRSALQTLFKAVSPSSIKAVGFSGQTGTYFLVENGAIRHSVFWHEPGREQALHKALGLFSQEEYISMTGMRHPHLASYPVPTILSLNAEGRMRGKLMQPKDYVIFLLTGEFISDPGSWRGLVNPKTQTYDTALLNALGIFKEALPEMKTQAKVSRAGEAVFGIPEGTDVFVGLNDFYAALFGLKADRAGDAFDITGTSEHFGVVTKELGERALTESPYLNDLYVRYGVTGSSGASLIWGIKTFGPLPDAPVSGAPIFLPYLRGERQIDPDPFARGMFLGLTEHADRRALAYSVAEGVVFSIYRMYELLGKPEIETIYATGGATAFPLLNRLKAAAFMKNYVAKKPDCGSALGAVRAAGGEWTEENEEYLPDPALHAFLMERYEVYRRMYGAWKSAAENADIPRLFGKDDCVWQKR